MNLQFSQKTTWLCFAGGLAFVLVAGIVFEFLSADSGSTPRVIERVVETANGPVTVYETVEPSPDPIVAVPTESTDPMAEDSAGVSVLSAPDWNMASDSVGPAPPDAGESSNDTSGPSEDESEDPFF